MEKMAVSNVLVSGLGGLGVEIGIECFLFCDAKNHQPQLYNTRFSLELHQVKILILTVLSAFKFFHICCF